MVRTLFFTMVGTAVCVWPTGPCGIESIMPWPRCSGECCRGNPDGTFWREFDLPAKLVEKVEEIARKKRRSFNVFMTRAIEAGLARALRKLRGF